MSYLTMISSEALNETIINNLWGISQLQANVSYNISLSRITQNAWTMHNFAVFETAKNISANYYYEKTAHEECKQNLNESISRLGKVNVNSIHPQELVYNIDQTTLINELIKLSIYRILSIFSYVCEYDKKYLTNINENDKKLAQIFDNACDFKRYLGFWKKNWRAELKELQPENSHYNHDAPNIKSISKPIVNLTSDTYVHQKDISYHINKKVQICFNNSIILASQKYENLTKKGCPKILNSKTVNLISDPNFDEANQKLTIKKSSLKYGTDILKDQFLLELSIYNNSTIALFYPKTQHHEEIQYIIPLCNLEDGLIGVIDDYGSCSALCIRPYDFEDIPGQQTFYLGLVVTNKDRIEDCVNFSNQYFY